MEQQPFHFPPDEREEPVIEPVKSKARPKPQLRPGVDIIAEAVADLMVSHDIKEVPLTQHDKEAVREATLEADRKIKRNPFLQARQKTDH